MTEINAIIILRAYEIGLCLLGPHRPTSLQPCLSPELGSMGIWVGKLNDVHYLPLFQPSLEVVGVQGIVQKGSEEDRVINDNNLGAQHFAGALTYLACTAPETIHPAKSSAKRGVVPQ